jgi:hypothetical protein
MPIFVLANLPLFLLELAVEEPFPALMDYIVTNRECALHVQQLDRPVTMPVQMTFVPKLLLARAPLEV